MFGLMKYYGCSSSKKERIRYRQHYCGVCKSLGKLYGQHTRFLLNRDLVFLSEVLTELSPETFPSEAAWNRPRSRIDNCFKSPRRRDDIPLSLQIAATYNVLMSRFKVEDNIADARQPLSLLWKSAGAGFLRAFKKAAQQVNIWEYPLDEVSWWMKEQRRREAEALPPQDAEHALNFFAEPSAHTSGLSMKHAAMVIRRTDKAELMYTLGYRFGRLIYLLDALEDFTDDCEKEQFNALRAAYRITGKELPANILQKAQKLCRSLETEMQEALSALELSERQETRFTQRLARNMNRKLGREICSPRAKCDSARHLVEKMTLREKWRYANELSRKLAFTQSNSSPLAIPKAWLSFSVLFACLFSTPQQVLGYVTAQLETGTANNPDFLSLMFIMSWAGLAIGAAGRRYKAFNLTEKSFEKLKKDGVPDDILNSLESMQDREFPGESEFLTEIHKLIGEESISYQSTLLKHARVSRRKRTTDDADGYDDGDYDSSNSCCDACDCCYCGDCFNCGCLPENCGSGGAGLDAAGGGCDWGSCCDCGSCGDCGGGACDCGNCDCGGCDCDCGC